MKKFRDIINETQKGQGELLSIENELRSMISMMHGIKQYESVSSSLKRIADRIKNLANSL